MDGGEEVEFELGRRRPCAAWDQRVQHCSEDVVDQRCQRATVGGPERVEQLRTNIEFGSHRARSDLGDSDAQVFGNPGEIGDCRQGFGNPRVVAVKCGSRPRLVTHHANAMAGQTGARRQLSQRRSALVSSSGRGLSIAVRDLLDCPLVAVGISEVDKQAPGELLDLADINSTANQIRSGGFDVGDDHLHAPDRPRGDIRNPLSKW